MSAPPIPELLIYRTAFDRLQSELEGRVVPLIMDDDGVVRQGDTTLAPAAVKPDIAWANRDMYSFGPVRAFMVACLKSERLRWLQSSAAGFEHPVFASLAGNGVRLTNAAASAVPIAEYVFAQVLAAFHPVAERAEAQRAVRWESFEFRDVHGSTWLIYGVGHVGSEVARRARAFGAHVIGVRRTPAGDEPVDEMVSVNDLLSAVGRADVVVLTAALNEQNRHIVDSTFVGALKPGAVLVNVGRGGLIDESALLEGLDRGQPGHAALDVFETEPLPESSALWGHPGVRITAHCAGASPGTNQRGDEIFLTNLARYLADEPLLMQVTNVESAPA